VDENERERLHYRISTNPREIDVDAVHAYLVGSYWAQGIPRALVAKALLGSLCFGLFQREHQVG